MSETSPSAGNSAVPPLQSVVDGKAPVPAVKPRSARGPNGRFSRSVDGAAHGETTVQARSGDGTVDGPRTVRTWLIYGAVLTVITVGAWWYFNRRRSAHGTVDGPHTVPETDRDGTVDGTAHGAGDGGQAPLGTVL